MTNQELVKYVKSLANGNLLVTGPDNKLKQVVSALYTLAKQSPLPTCEVVVASKDIITRTGTPLVVTMPAYQYLQNSGRWYPHLVIVSRIVTYQLIEAGLTNV